MQPSTQGGFTQKPPAPSARASKFKGLTAAARWCRNVGQWVALAMLGLGSWVGSATAQMVPLDARLNEQVIQIPKPGLFTLNLETTLYKPDGDGPFPLVVINHGKALGNPRFQGRYRPALAARFFLQRGYAVLVPMRQGFSKSEGNYINPHCNVESNGRVQAEDVKAVLDYATAQPWVNKDQILVVGQSHGGWTTLAFGTLNYPGVRGLVNFAGGLRQDQCPGWESALARAAGGYGKGTRVPSLWFYGDNDSYFSPDTFRRMFDNYVAAGAPAKLVAFGTFGSDAHAMFGSRQGADIWQARVEAFMKELGLPTEVVFPKFASQPPLPVPPATNFAALTDVDKVPYIRASGREGYKTFLTKQFPRAFAISASGAWGWAEQGDDPLQRALDNCNRHAKTTPCRLYAVDDQVVWKPD